MKKIRKYLVDMVDKQIVNLPVGAEILTFQTIDDDPYLWAMINPKEKRTEERYIEMFGTERPIDTGKNINRKYLATFQLKMSKWVGHVFEKLD